MDLETFKNLVLDWISTNKLNIKLSGAARVENEGQTYWSASCYLNGTGIFPPIERTNIIKVREIMQKHQLSCDLTPSRIFVVNFIRTIGDEDQRWQLMWTAKSDQ